MKVRFSDEARRRLHDIEAYIAEDSALNARKTISRLIDRAESLNQLHLRGRVVPEYGHMAVREVFERPYRIIYRIADREIQILTIMHYRRLLPGELAGLR